MAAPWDANPGWSAGATTAETSDLVVYGAPGDGKVPAWNATAGRLEWGTPSGGGGGGASEQLFATLSIGTPGVFSAPSGMIPVKAGAKQIVVSWPLVLGANGQFSGFFIDTPELTDDLSVSYAEITVTNAACTQMRCVGTGSTIVVPAGGTYQFQAADFSENGHTGTDLALVDDGGGGATIKSTAGGAFTASLWVQLA